MLLPVELVLLHKAPLEFILTGSHYFGGATMNSDYDFFVQASLAVTDWLEDNGWKKTIAEPYSDINTVSVYKRGPVHVQVTYDSAWKGIVQEWIKTSYPLFHLCTKSTRAGIWKLGYKVNSKPSIFGA
jgi:hypothetical protein